MKKLFSLFSLLVCLGISTNLAWGATLYFEGFEANHRTSGSNSYAAGPQEYGDWLLSYADAVTSGSPLTGTANVMMRVAKNTTNSPTLQSKVLLSSSATITKVSWNCKGATSQTLTVSYSTDNNTWTQGYSATMSTTAAVKSFTLNNVAGPIYLKFVVSVESSTGSNRDAQIDDITIEGTASSSACADPTFSLATGTYASAQNVTISCGTDGATIHYTTNGNDPTTSSPTYSSAIAVSTTTTIKALAAKSGLTKSAVVSATYTIVSIEHAGTESDPYTVADARNAIAVGGDLSNKYVSGIISKVDSYSDQYHSITYWISDDGTTTNQLEVYSGKGLNGADFSAVTDLQVADEVTVKGTLKLFNSTYEFDKNNQLVSFNRPGSATPCATPTFSPAAGKYTAVQSVTISSETTGATIYYTTDGTTPTNESSVYSAAISVGENMTIKAIAMKEGMENSFVATATYTINLPLPSHDFEEVHEFTTGEGFEFPTGWTSAYAEHEINYTNDKVVFAEANQQSAGSTIVDCPVTKGKAISLVLTNPTNWISAVRFDYKQWAAKTSTLVMKYSTDGGANYTAFDPAITATNFAIQNLALPTGVNAIQVTGTDGNQIGLVRISFDLDNVPVVHGSITYVENGANENIDDVDDATNLPDPLPTVTRDGYAFGGWFTDSEFNTPAVAGAPLTGNVTLYAKWIEIPVWAYTYTSNVTLTADGGSNASTAKVKLTSDGTEYDALKAGTSSKVGALVVTVPAGATKLHFHAYGWNGESVTLGVTAPTGVTITPASVDIAANTGISGNSPFTLAEGSDPKTDAYYAVTLSGNSDETALTFTATSGKRFVLFGVNQEGAAVPVLERIEISGDLEMKSGYKAGDELDMTGLTVNAIYTLNSVEQDPVDVTNEVDWTYDALVENQTEVTVTATYGEKQAQKTITGLDPVASADPMIYVEPSLTVNFGAVAKDASVAAKTITITLQNVTAATATLGGTNANVFNISKTALVDGDEIEISVLSTATVGNYSATITITDNAENASAKTVNISLEVDEVETAVSTSSKWVAATAEDIVDGKEVLIVGANEGDTYAMGEQKSNNRGAVAASIDNEGVLTPDEGTMSFTLVAQGDGTFALRTSDGKYLYAASSSANQLKKRDAVGDDNNANWTVSVASVVANGNNRGVMRFNYNNGSPLFACYASNSTTGVLPTLYVRQQEDTPDPVYDFEDVRSGLEIGRHYTACLKKKIVAVQGATIWGLSQSNSDKTVAYLVEETLPLPAGAPFIYQATDATFKAAYEGDEADEPIERGALRGTFDGMTSSQLEALTNVYLMYQNAFHKSGTGNTLGERRAYLLYDELEVVDEAPQPAPGRRVKGMTMQENVATDIEDAEASAKPMKKLIDGQLFILCGEKLYDATGRQVK